MGKVTENLLKIKSEIAKAARKYNKNLNSIQLLAISKLHDITKIREAFEAGQTAFGESYLQEALPKITALPSVEWHFVGPIQSNKTKKIAEHFAWVHSVTNQKIAERFNAQRPAHLPPLNICIEVKTSPEITKFGISFEEVETLAKYCQNLPHLKLRGLMTIPKASFDFEEQRQPFKALADVFHKLNAKGFALDTLSMGMSNDFEAAIVEGSTMLRIGSGIFGERS